MEILKTRVLHKEVCVQSLWETVECGDKGKNKRMLHKDAFLRICEFVRVYTFKLWAYNKKDIRVPGWVKVPSWKLCTKRTGVVAKKFVRVKVGQ